MQNFKKRNIFIISSTLIMLFVFVVIVAFTNKSTSAQTTTYRIMPLGDSITEGVNGGYRNGVWNGLTSSGYSIDLVGSRYDQYTRVPDKDHQGTPGHTVGNILGSIDGLVNTHRPNIILLMIGVNDFAWWHVEGAPAVANRLGSVLDRVKTISPNTHVIVSSITPMKGVNAQGTSRDALGREYNQLIRSQVSSRAASGMKVSFVDMYAAISTSDLYDDVHPTESAAVNKMAPVWNTAIRQVISGNVVPIPTAVATASPTPTRAPTPTTGTITSAPIPTTPPLTGSMSGLKVQGSKIVNNAGQAIRLIGVNHSGGEYSCVGGSSMTTNPWGFFETNQTASQLIAGFKSWGINTVRIPLNETCWLGYDPDTRTNVSTTGTYINEYRKYSGEAYKTAVQNLVNALTAQNIAVVLEIHWSAPGRFIARNQSPMLNRQNSIPAWRDIANRFKGNSAVIFDPLNEPFHRFGDDGSNSSIAAWECWKLGSLPGDSTNSSRCVGMGEWYDLTGNAFQGGSAYKYEVAGMDEIVQTIRSTGSTNIIMLGGMAYSNNLTRWLSYKPNDSNLAASWHVYNFNICNNITCWNDKILPVHRQVPVVVGEIGQSSGGRDFVDAITPWFDQNGMSYLAWTWNQWGCSGMQLMRDYTGAVNTGCAYSEGQYAAIRRSLASAPVPTAPIGSTNTPTPTRVVSNTATPTLVASPTSSTVLCAQKPRGDANCDGKINLADFEILRQELNGLVVTKQADFDNNGMVNNGDYTIWLSNY